jgi:hypothetical protein
MKIRNLKIGADPELFLEDESGFVSSEGLIGGSKDEPRDIGLGCYVQEDNVAVEFNIPPVDNEDDFVRYIEYSIGVLKEMVGNQFKFSTISSAEFNEMYLSTPHSKRSACAPDYNVWNNCEANMVPLLGTTNLRSSGAHLHFGYSSPTIEVSNAIVKMSDVFITIPTLKYENREAAILRRGMYGSAGSFRYKPYGVEYRTLSSFWIGDEEKTREIYHRASGISSKINEDILNDIDKDKDAITEAIDYHYEEAIDYIIDKYKIAV